MFKRQTLFFFLAAILSGVLNVQAGSISIDTDVVQSSTSDPSLGGDTILQFLAPNASQELIPFHTLVLNESDLEIVNFTLGAELTIFPATVGTEITASNITDFDSVFDGSAGPNMAGNLGLPDGESYFGFGLRVPSIDSPWTSIGWVKFDRTGDEFTLLSSAVNHGMPPFSGESSGITVGVVPEPSGIMLMAIAALAMVRFRRR